jgi:hypothetical protein
VSVPVSAPNRQRLHARATGRIDYRSASMMEFARVKHDTEVMVATAIAEEEEAAEARAAAAPSGAPPPA